MHTSIAVTPNGEVVYLKTLCSNLLILFETVPLSDINRMLNELTMLVNEARLTNTIVDHSELREFISHLQLSISQASEIHS